MCGGCNCVETKDACPKFHIIICTIFIFLSLFFAVLSTLLTLVFSSLSFMFAVCFALSPLLYDSFISLLGFRVGPSIAVSRANGPSFALFFLSFSSLPYLLRTLLVILHSLFYATDPLSPHPPIQANVLPARVLLEFKCVCHSCMISPLLLRLVRTCSRPPLAFTFAGLQPPHYWHRTSARVHQRRPSPPPVRYSSCPFNAPS